MNKEEYSQMQKFELKEFKNNYGISKQKCVNKAKFAYLIILINNKGENSQ